LSKKYKDYAVTKYIYIHKTEEDIVAATRPKAELLISSTQAESLQSFIKKTIHGHPGLFNTQLPIKAESLLTEKQAETLHRAIERAIRESLPLFKSQLRIFNKILTKNHVNFSEAKKLTTDFDSFFETFEFCFHLIEFASSFNVSIAHENLFSFQALRVDAAKKEREIKSIKEHLLTIQDASDQTRLSAAIARALEERVKALQASPYTRLFDIASGLTKGFTDKIETLAKKRDSLLVIQHCCIRELIVSETLRGIVISLNEKSQREPLFQENLSKYKVARETVKGLTSLEQFSTFLREFTQWRQSQAKETLDQMETTFCLLGKIGDHLQFLSVSRLGQDDEELLIRIRPFQEINPRNLGSIEIIRNIDDALRAFKFIKENEESFKSALKLTPIVTLSAAVSARTRGPRRQRSLSVTRNPLRDSNSDSSPTIEAKRGMSKEYGDTRKPRLFTPEKTPEVRAKAAELAEEAKTVALRRMSGPGTSSGTS
jgi:hypothetical protein